MDNDNLGNPTASFSEFYAAFIGRLGLDRNEATSNLDSRNHLVEQYEAQQDSIAGVSLDDEMAEIIKFQHIYQASARLITTTSEMLDVLLNM
jgi:flagellar hook-associated protein 1 FlgK